MGLVYEVAHERLGGRRFAVKVLTANLGESGELLPRFRREAEICSKLNHPNCIHVTDWNELPSGMPFLVMEYLEGETLAQRLERGPVDASFAQHLVREVGAGLAAAHALGIVHRDLKPGNLFLCDPGPAGGLPHVVILDFGISKLTNEPTLETTSPKLLGSPRYMSPEQARGRASEVDARTDQFSFAVILYEALAGTPAFEGEDLASLLYCIVHETPASLIERVPRVPQHMVGAIERAMSKRADERLADIQSFVEVFCGVRPMPPNVVREATTAEVSDGALVARVAAWPDPNETEPIPATSEEPIAAARIDARAASGRPRRAGATVVLVLFGSLLCVGAVLFWLAREGQRLAEAGYVGASGSVAAPALASAPAPVPDPLSGVPAQPQREDTRVATPAAGLSEAQQGASDPNVEAPSESSEVRAHLDAAQVALDASDPTEAARKARQAVALQDVPRAHRLLALAACVAGDLGGARAAYRRVRGADRALVRASCLERDIKLPR